MAVRHFYVDSNNANHPDDQSDTSYGARQTGAMSSLTDTNVYADLGQCVGISSPPIDGDFIYVANNHDASYANGATPIINPGGAKNDIGVQIISVNNADIDEYMPGASDAMTDGSYEYNFRYNAFISGVSLSAMDDVIQSTQVENGRLTLQDLTITTSTGTGDTPFKLDRKVGYSVHCINVDLVVNGAGNRMNFQAGNRLIMDGGSISGSVMTTIFDTAFGGSGGAQVIFNGVDLSSQSGTILPATADNQETFLLRFTNCKLHANVTFHGELALPHHRFEVFNSDEAGGSLHRFYVADGTGSAKNNDTVYVTATEGWYGGSDKSSIQVETTSICSKIVPFVFELPAQYVDLSDTDTIEIELWSETTLTAGDICAFLVYPDGTTVTQPNWVSTGPSVGSGNYGHDPLSTANIVKSAAGAGSANLGASDWTGESGTPLYYTLTLDTSGNAGAVSAVSVRIEVYKASITDPIYIHPLFTLS